MILNKEEEDEASIGSHENVINFLFKEDSNETFDEIEFPDINEFFQDWEVIESSQTERIKKPKTYLFYEENEEISETRNHIIQLPSDFDRKNITPIDYFSLFSLIGASL